MTRYLPAKHYLWWGVLALVFAGLCAWLEGRVFPPLAAYPAAALFGISAVLLLAMVLRPAIEIHEGYLSVGKRVIPWMDIRRLDRTGWISPLIVRITLFDDSHLLLVYPGELLAPAGADRKQGPPPRYRILRPEDEAEVERLYQRLKTVGNLDQKKSTDEK